MAVGFQRRILDEALARAKLRSVGGRSLLSYDQVERRLAEIQAAHTVSAAFCRDSIRHIALDKDLSGEGLLANIHKALLTDHMQQSSQSFLQLSGGDGYRFDRLAGQAIIDSRPFMIFEGSNDVLYDQIATTFLAATRVKGEASLSALLSLHDLTRPAARRFAELLGFALSGDQTQRRSVDIGRILARVVATGLLEKLGAAGYEPALVAGAIEVLRSEVAGIAALVAGDKGVRLVEEYPASPPWQDCLAT
jgi:hypothetical protein